MARGYMGKILRVNLTIGKFTVDPLPTPWIKDFIGGDGFGAKLLFTEVPGGTDPLNEMNKLIIATGPITGTMWPMSGRTVFISKAPLTGIWGESHVGGFLGAELKYAGYDMLVVEGKSEKPVYIIIEDSDLQIVDAKQLWGLTTDRLTKSIQKMHNDPDIQVAAIGPAGERLVRYASVIVNHARAAGRTGMGAVLGSKNVKGIAIRGHGSVEVFDHSTFMDLAKEAHSRVRSNPQARQMGKYGTWVLTAVKQEIGELPTYNHQTGVFDGWEKLSGDYIRPKYTVADRACFGCSLGCKKVNYIREGPYAGTLEEGPEYEGLMAFGSSLGIDDYATTLKANQICNRYGLDIISAGATIGFAIEAFVKGAITTKETGGFKLQWGDREQIINLLQSIANREGFGDLLAEGSKKASEKLGRGTDKFAIHVKGMEVSGQDGRTHRSIALGHATGARGADHLRSLVVVDQLGYEDVAARRWGADKLPEIIDPYTEKYKATAVFESENAYSIRDTLIVCWYSVSWPPREGITKKDDNLPDRFTKDPMPEGPGKGQTVDLEPMLRDYYVLRGWDLETGLPTRDTIKRLSLEWAKVNS
jgi:aldehyde:ferredoxin oxidoreductase